MAMSRVGDPDFRDFSRLVFILMTAKSLDKVLVFIFFIFSFICIVLEEYPLLCFG